MVGFDMNCVILDRGKSKLINRLRYGCTLVVNIGKDDLRQCVDEGIVISEFDNYKHMMEDSWFLSELHEGDYDTIIFYSNDVITGKDKYFERIFKHVNHNKCIFMFRRDGLD